MALILGIDPGSRKTGFGVINQIGHRLEYITSGVIQVAREPTMTARLDAIFTYVTKIINQYSLQSMAIEQIFLGKSADSALKLGQARGVAIVAATQANLEVYEYAARKVKQAVSGKGNGTKEQVAYMVKALLKLPDIPQEDAADALAVAICHAYQFTGLVKIAGAKHSRRGRMMP